MELRDRIDDLALRVPPSADLMTAEMLRKMYADAMAIAGLVIRFDLGIEAGREDAK